MPTWLIALWRSPHVLTYFLSIVQVCIVIRYGFAHDWARVAYWCAILVIVWSTVFMKGPP